MDTQQPRLDPAQHAGTHRDHGAGRHLLERWPSVVGLLALLLNVTNGADAHVTAMIIVIASACYLATSAIGPRRSGWIVVGGAVVTVMLARVTGLDPTVAVLVLGAAFAVLGLLRGADVDRRELGIQVLGFLGFSALALTAMMVGPVPALYLAALAAVGHAAWDLVHVVRDRVVPRSLAEACFVLDLGLGAAMLWLAAVAPA
ncbi:hypothetical protein [Cellulosimicrobium cellulans]|uniref:Uncharacterized protein n=1 Tax=Cellulosimicrobium cellulans TaxID=1710 RepID=A0A4Y4DY00_CELCE|nr:hypothetical protein [Cellulosimicrobium cellulans]GED10309.1 hypothetical protein CCE02nite_23080 [Cellulosimicrobium cellulans]